ncbi:hypothetical protein MMA231_00934 [Asticcacaulis sp. MM231]|uniref:hypothetical protein n=1 Tax=Asticcacaulis sp. MM231 TaxID=3157666 RepID=UPI0032D5A66C
MIVGHMARIPHPEEIKALLRIAETNMTAFEKRYDLPRGSTFDVLRGRTTTGRTIEALASAVGIDVSIIVKSVKRANRLSLSNYTSEKSDSHRLNEGAK